jgi:hypothetical protein
MAFSLRRWRPRHLLAAWGTYWAGLAAGTVGQPSLALWRITRQPPGGGSATFGFDNATLHGTVVEHGVTVWTGAAHLLTITAWLAIPPLLLWVLWLAYRPRRATSHDATAPGMPSTTGAGIRTAAPPDAARPELREAPVRDIGRDAATPVPHRVTRPRDGGG